MKVSFSPPAFLAATAWTFGAAGSGFAHASGEPLLGVAGATVALAGSVGLRVLSDRWERQAFRSGFASGRLAERVDVDRIRRDREAA